jgi:hypothetical protein
LYCCCIGRIFDVGVGSIGRIFDVGVGSWYKLVIGVGIWCWYLVLVFGVGIWCWYLVLVFGKFFVFYFVRSKTIGTSRMIMVVLVVVIIWWMGGAMLLVRCRSIGRTIDVGRIIDVGLGSWYISEFGVGIWCWYLVCEAKQSVE